MKCGVGYFNYVFIHGVVGKLEIKEMAFFHLIKKCFHCNCGQQQSTERVLFSTQPFLSHGLMIRRH